MKEDRRESFLRRGQAWFQKKTTETINVVLPAPSLSPMKTQEFNNNTPSRVLLILIKRQFVSLLSSRTRFVLLSKAGSIRANLIMCPMMVGPERAARWVKRGQGMARSILPCFVLFLSEAIAIGELRAYKPRSLKLNRYLWKFGSFVIDSG